MINKSIFLGAALTCFLVAAAYGQTPDARALFAQGFEDLKVNKAKEAAVSFQAGLKLDPKNALAWFYLGEAQSRNGGATAAANAYRKSLELDPKSTVAQTAQSRLTSLSAAASTPNVFAVKDPKSVALPSGATLADWQQYAVDQLKAGKQDQVLRDGAAYRDQYGAVENLDGLLAKALEDKLATIPLKTAADATAALPTLDDLSTKFPDSAAVTSARRARGIIATSEAQSKHAMADFDGAREGYRQALSLLPDSDELRKEIVGLITEAEAGQVSSRPLLVGGKVFAPVPGVSFQQSVQISTIPNLGGSAPNSLGDISTEILAPVPPVSAYYSETTGEDLSIPPSALPGVAGGDSRDIFGAVRCSLDGKGRVLPECVARRRGAR